MNAIMFGTKRAFHGFLRVSRRPLAWLGLTAARFDLMAAIVMRNHRSWPSKDLRQSELRKILGVTAPVITRMAKSLEALGLVRRERDPRDRRQVRVVLTDAGKECIMRAWHVMTRAMRRLVDVALCGGKHRDRDLYIERMMIVEGCLDVLRTEFGDTANLYYRWGHPDD